MYWPNDPILCNDRFGVDEHKTGNEFPLHGVSSVSAQILDSSSVHACNGVYTIAYVVAFQDSFLFQVCTVEQFKCHIRNIQIILICRWFMEASKIL
jgi:hypothetical protein